MRCGFCGHEFEPAEGVTGCGACRGGCHGIHCPRCGYKNIEDTGVIRKIRKMLNRNTKEQEP